MEKQHGQGLGNPGQSSFQASGLREDNNDPQPQVAPPAPPEVQKGEVLVTNNGQCKTRVIKVPSQPVQRCPAKGELEKQSAEGNLS